MKFKVTTAGSRYTEEQAKKLETLGCTFDHQQNIRKILSYGEIEISTLEELVEFSEEWGEIIITPGEIEIYDDYRE